MKLLKLALVVSALVGSATAATINISPGFGAANGIIVTTDGVTSSYSLSVGGFEGGLFTPFVTPQVELAAGAKIAGGFSGVGPTSLNGDAIFIRVQTAAGFAILSTVNEFFPGDVTNALASESITLSNSSVTSIVSSEGGASFTNPNTLNFVAIPEPSTALLGLLGVAGLIRRRR